MGYRINERNTGSYTLEGSLKQRSKSKVLSNDEKSIAATILNKVYDAMEYDNELKANVDGGRITLMLSTDDMIALRQIIIKLEK